MSIQARSEAKLVYEQWLRERQIFDSDLLEQLADLPRPQLIAWADENFDEEEARLIVWQATITKAHRSPADFAEVASRGTFQRSAFTDLINDVIVDACYNQRFVIIAAGVRSGKLLAETELVPTPNGFAKVKDILPGDVVFDQAGKKTNVIARRKETNVDLFEVTFSDGSKIITHREHEWTVLSQKYRDRISRLAGNTRQETRLTHWPEDWWKPRQLTESDLKLTVNEGNINTVTRTTNEIADSIEMGWGIPTTGPLELKEKNLPIDPYVLGLWLADGSATFPQITAHVDDQDHIVKEFAAKGYELRQEKNRKEHLNCLVRDGGVLKYDLQDLGVWDNKHVPEAYLWGSVDQRLALLSGLMDGDGGPEINLSKKDSKGDLTPRFDGRTRTISGRVSFANTNKTLVDAVYHLAISLGEKPTRDECPAICHYPDGTSKDTGKVAYRVSWSAYNFNPFRLPRKAEMVQMNKQKHLTRGMREIRLVEFIGKGDGYCFEVDSPSHLYLAGESMIPTHNSFLSSQWAPAWYLAKFPEREMILGAHSKKLAASLSGKVRDILEETAEPFFGLRLDSSNKSKESFRFEGYRNSGLNSLGVGGGPIGFGGHLIILDDVYKNFKQAYSPAYNRQLQEWHKGSIRSRLNGGGSIVVVLARWKVDDYAGWLLDEFKLNPQSDPWIEIKIPQLAMENDPLGRQPGEPLVPDRFPLEEVLRTKASVGPITWQSQYQQMPQATTNSMFPPEKWGHVDINEAKDKIRKTVLYWDLSAGGARSDYVAGVLLGADEHGLIYVLDVCRQKFTSAQASLEIEDYVRSHSTRIYREFPGVKIYFEQTAGAGKGVASHYMRKVFNGLPAEPYNKSNREKTTMAYPYSMQQQAENIFIVVQKSYDKDEGESGGFVEDPFDWYTDFVQEHLVFGDDRYNDDQVDAASGAYEKLAEMLDSGIKHKLSIVKPSDVIESRKEMNQGFNPDLLSRSTISEQIGIEKPKPKSRKAQIYRARR